jgi:hypothetical protein
MIKRGMLLIMLVLVLVNYIYPVKLHTFPELYAPGQFVLDNQYIYISDPRNPGNKVFIYGRTDFKPVKALLKKGEGPREIIGKPTLAVDNQKINIFAKNKILFYSKEFKYMKEIKLSFSDSFIVPIGDNFIIVHPEGDGKVVNEVYTLYSIRDNNFKKIKDLVKIPVEMKELEKYLVVFASTMVTWKDKAFISTQNAFHIDVFDENGGKLYTIEKKSDPIESKEKHREREIEELIDRYGKRLYEAALKERFDKKKLPTILPGIKNMNVGEDRLYVQTYDIRAHEDKYIILDFKGKIVDTIWLPKTFGKKRYFFDNRFYYFCENENDKGWELHMIEIKK